MSQTLTQKFNDTFGEGAAEKLSEIAFREGHNLDFINPVEFQLWVLDNADLKSFDGDYPDGLGVLSNAYEGYMQ